MRTNSDLTAAVIDALSNLNVETETAAEVLPVQLQSLCILLHDYSCKINATPFFCVQILDVALGRVSSANLADLPTVIKFIMQQVTAKNAQEVCQYFVCLCCYRALQFCSMLCNLLCCETLKLLKGGHLQHVISPG